MQNYANFDDSFFGLSLMTTRGSKQAWLGLQQNMVIYISRAIDTSKNIFVSANWKFISKTVYYYFSYMFQLMIVATFR